MVGKKMRYRGLEYDIMERRLYDKHFNFVPIFDTWREEYTLITPGAGHHDYTQGGIWVEDPPTETVEEAIILPLTNDDIKHDGGGIYTTQDLKMYVQQPSGYQAYYARRVGETGD